MQTFIVVLGTVAAIVSSDPANSNPRETRLAGYKTLFKYPAPWGLRDPAIEAKMSGTDVSAKSNPGSTGEARPPNSSAGPITSSWPTGS